MDPTASSAWDRLTAHAADFDSIRLAELFADDDDRANRCSHRVGDLLIDLSKHRVTDAVTHDLIALANDQGVDQRFRAMVDGERINSTEDRSVLHTALRAPRDAQLVVDGVDITATVHEVLDAMALLANDVRDGRFVGHTGKAITTVVNIGIGGSDLGPVMAYEALHAYHHDRIRCRFVSNVDSADLAVTLADCDPETTLFLVASKTFTTAETITNATSARRWLIDALGDDAVARHFVALSTNAEAVAAFGIDTANMFGFWDWVGGRYSLNSAIGLSLMIAIGPDRFREMLDGFAAIDRYMADTPAGENVVTLAALIEVWYRSFCGITSRVVLPYANALHRFPAYLQQLDMESNGKQVRADGSRVSYETGPIVWGEPGTNGQHSFHQLLHQGTSIAPADFIVFARPDIDFDGAQGHHDQLVANCFAQAEALAFGKSAEEVAKTEPNPDLVAHRTFDGNRPSTMILAPALTPSTFGQLVAVYEHQVFVQGVVWGINSFDQWGVELGKALATSIVAELQSDTEPELAHDSSTNALITAYRTLRG